MYSFSVTQQLKVFAESFGFGFFLGVIYSAVWFVSGIFTITKKRAVICDIIFSVLASLLLFTFFLSFNYGKIRLYSVIGILFGVVVFFLSVGTLFANISEIFLRGMRRAMHTAVRPFKSLHCTIKGKILISKCKISNKFRKNISETIANENEIVV